jgi:ERCC4-type nuclease
MQPIDRDVYKPRLIKQKRISTTDLRLDVLTTVPGISEKKAKTLIDEFGSLMEIGETPPSEIAMLDGFGKVLAERLHEMMNSEETQVI